MSHICPEVEDVGLKVETVEEQCDMNVKDGVSVDDGLNVIFSLSSGTLKLFIGMVFNDREDAYAFFKVYVRS